jgi:hypothetical protein
MSNLSDEQSNIGNVLGKLQSLKDRQKNRTSSTLRSNPTERTVTNNIQQQIDNIVEEKEVYTEPEIIPESSAQRMKDDEQYHSAQKIAEEVIPVRPITLRVNPVFTPENMYDQVKSDYIGFIRQAINETLDAVAVFYMQGKRFAESKDLRIFLLKNIQQSVSSLKDQYIAKFPLISGLPEMIAKVEQNEAQVFRSMTSDFVNRMISNTFGQ